MPGRKATVTNLPKPQRTPLTEEALDALACAEADRRLRTEKTITLDEVFKKHGWRRKPRAMAR